MSTRDQRRSPRHLAGGMAEVHVGPNTVQAAVIDVSAHGMGLMLPSDSAPEPGELIWIVAADVAPYAITATVRRRGQGGFIGVEFEEILTGEALESVESMPMPEDTEDTDDTDDHDDTDNVTRDVD